MLLFLVAAYSLIMAKGSYAQCSNKDECTNQIKDYEKKINQLQDQKKTLSSQIGLMDAKISLTTTKIKTTEYTIEKTATEIDSLGDKIVGLNSSLDYLTRVLLEKIVESYKNKDVSTFDVILDSQNAGVLGNKIKYLDVAQNSDRRLAFRLQQTKQNFEEQKNLREEKKKQLEQLEVDLNSQKKVLGVQKVEKQSLLNDTLGSESTYQRLLAQARLQLSGFSSFVQNSGASSIIGAGAFGNGSDGAYFSQRDVRWATQTIGSSPETILDVGCLLSSVAMVGKRFGANVTPSTIASEVGRFWGNTAYMRNPWQGVAGKTYTGGVNIDVELQNGNPVVVGVGKCASGGSHFVVLLKKDGDSYIMHDPIYGPDTKFSDHYSNICTSATFK